MHKPNGFLGDLDKNEAKYPCRAMGSLRILVSTSREGEVKNRVQNQEWRECISNVYC